MIGTRRRRLEDPRLLRGRGRFVDDVDVAGQCWMRVVRSQAAHADIDHVDVKDALAVDGVVGVLTAGDLPGPVTIPMRLPPAESLDDYLQPVLAADRIRYVGEPVAIVLAEDPYLAEDAADLVRIATTPRDVIVDARTACRVDGAQLRDSLSNEVTTIDIGFGDVDAAFADAAHVVAMDAHIGRHSGVPLETRGLVAAWDRGRDGVTLWGTTKVSHFNRSVLAEMLDLPVGRVHLRGTDAGGGFGVRGEFYPEDFLVPWAARVVGRPVKWVEDRSEHLVAANHSREQQHAIEVAFDERGTLLALRDEIWHDNGAYLRTHGIIVADLTATMLPGPYRLSAYRAVVHVATTNKTPAGTYRGPGRYEGTFARERLLDVAAERMGVDPVDLRRRNLLAPDELPCERALETLGTDVILDAGKYADLLDRGLEASGFDDWREEARALRDEGRLVGAGFAFFLEKSGLGPYETASIDIDQTGGIRLGTGGASLGQGIETVLAQIAADELGVEPEDIEVVHGDTDVVPDGVGSWASRSTVVGGGAVHRAARQAADKTRRVGAELLGVSVEKAELEGGRVQISGSDVGVTLSEVATACDPLSSSRRGDAPGLRADGVFTVDRMTYPYGVHFAQVEVDRETGGIDVRRYFVAYEVGTAVNPMLVEGQLAGGFAQGLGGALMEEFGYDGRATPTATTFLDYLLPTASEVPGIGVLIREDSPAPDNPLGVRGAGEGGATGAGAALANAVADALQVCDAVHQLPLTPVRVRAIITDDGVR